MKKILSLILILLLTAGSFIGCKKDNGDPPALPPIGSMAIDFSNFNDTKKGSYTVNDQKGIENSNWEFAALVASVWNVILTVNLAVPVTSFKLAIDQNAVYLDNKTWQWSYNVPVLGVSYTARLTGQIGETEVIWKMYISSASIKEFTWFEGTSKLDGTSGQWILNESAQSPTPLLRIDWTKTNNTVGNIKYTYVKNGDVFNTSYIEYGLTSGDLDAFYNIHYRDAVLQRFSDINIEWSTVLHNGRIKSSDYLEGQWYCWDANRVNIVCP